MVRDGVFEGCRGFEYRDVRAGGAAAPTSPAGGADAGGLSKTQKRRAQRDAALERAQRAGLLDGRSRVGCERLTQYPFNR